MSMDRTGEINMEREERMTRKELEDYIKKSLDTLKTD
jgi:hypothetical protein